MPLSDLDRVQIQKQESAAGGGDAADVDDFFPNVPLDSGEDAVEVRGIMLQDAEPAAKDKSTGIYRDGSDMVFADASNGATEYTLSELVAGGGGLTESTHEALDTLTHNLSETHYLEVTRTSGRVTNVTMWTDNGKTQKVREVDITRTSNRVSSYSIKQYDGSGTLKDTLTGTIARTGGRVSSIEVVKT